MESGLKALWNKFSLFEDEKIEVVIEKSQVEETVSERKNCLIGKVLIKQVINLETMKSVFYKIWKLFEV